LNKKDQTQKTIGVLPKIWTKCGPNLEGKVMFFSRTCPESPKVFQQRQPLSS